MSAYLGEPAQPVPVPGPPAPSAWQGTSQGGICPSSGVPANSTNLTSLCRAGPSPEASSSLLAWGASLWLWQSLLSRAAPPCGCSGPCRVSHGVPLCGCGSPCPSPQHLRVAAVAPAVPRSTWHQQVSRKLGPVWPFHRRQYHPPFLGCRLYLIHPARRVPHKWPGQCPGQPGHRWLTAGSGRCRGGEGAGEPCAARLANARGLSQGSCSSPPIPLQAPRLGVHPARGTEPAASSLGSCVN